MLFHNSLLVWAACFLHAFFDVIVFANDCSVQPLSLPIANTTLGDGVVLNRGVSMRVGKAILGLRISTLFNTTRVRSSRDCSAENLTATSECIGTAGSIFDVSKSPTWTTAGPGEWNVSSIDEHNPGARILRGWDTAKFLSTRDLPGFPLEIWSNPTSVNRSGLAFGPDSSVLDFLETAKLIPSQVFGIFFGSRSQLRGVDGSITIGGYDRARVSGEWTNFSMETQYLLTPCPLQVLIKDIRLDNVEGSFSLLENYHSAVPACVDPWQNVFTLSKSMYRRFVNLTDAPPTTNKTQIVWPASAEPLLGNLTVTLSNGYTTVVPHHELVSQERGTNAQGAYDVVNASAISVSISVDNDPNTELTPILGGVYLSANYLLVDYANRKFSLAPAVVGPPIDGAQDIVTICSNPPVPPTPSNGSNKTVTIVGSVLGVVVLLGVVAGIVIGKRWPWKRQKTKSQNTLPIAEEPDQHLQPDPVCQPVVAEKEGQGKVSEIG